MGNDPFGVLRGSVAGVGADVCPVDRVGDRLNRRAGEPAPQPEVPVLGPSEVAPPADDDMGDDSGDDLDDDE